MLQIGERLSRKRNGFNEAAHHGDQDPTRICIPRSILSTRSMSSCISIPRPIPRISMLPPPCMRGDTDPSPDPGVDSVIPLRAALLIRECCPRCDTVG